MKSRFVTTGVGSVPYLGVDDALEHVFKYDVPFLPELPKRGEGALEYIRNPGKLLCLDRFKYEVKKRQSPLVKLQCMGPATLITSGYDEDEAVTRAYDHICAMMDGLESKAILFLDEPGLPYFQDYRRLKDLWEPLIKTFDVIPGLHCCGRMDWDVLFDSDIQIVNFDASQFDIRGYPKYRSGKRIAWGIRGIGDVKDFKEGDLLTATCGMATYTVEECENMLKTLQEVSRRLTSANMT